MPSTYYDYAHQAWVENGKYIRCGHLEAFDCKCYGKEHEGELPKNNLGSDNDR